MAFSTVWPGGSFMMTVSSASGETADTSAASTETAALPRLTLEAPGSKPTMTTPLTRPFARPRPGSSDWAAAAGNAITMRTMAMRAARQAVLLEGIMGRSGTGASLLTFRSDRPQADQAPDPQDERTEFSPPP